MEGLWAPWFATGNRLPPCIVIDQEAPRQPPACITQCDRSPPLGRDSLKLDGYLSGLPATFAGGSPRRAVDYDSSQRCYLQTRVLACKRSDQSIESLEVVRSQPCLLKQLPHKRLQSREPFNSLLIP